MSKEGGQVEEAAQVWGWQSKEPGQCPSKARQALGRTPLETPGLQVKGKELGCALNSRVQRPNRAEQRQL